jgi:hypothetical protein
LVLHEIMLCWLGSELWKAKDLSSNELILGIYAQNPIE